MTFSLAAAAAKSLQSCLTLCDPMDGSPPGSPVPGILQARTLEWVAISFSNAWKWKVKVKSLSRVRLFVTAWTVAHQASPSMGFCRQGYWSGLPLPSPNNALEEWKILVCCSRGKTESKIQVQGCAIKTHFFLAKNLTIQYSKVLLFQRKHLVWIHHAWQSPKLLHEITRTGLEQ